MIRQRPSSTPRVLLLLILLTSLAACGKQVPTRRTPGGGILQRTGDAPLQNTLQFQPPSTTAPLGMATNEATSIWLPPSQTPTPSTLPDYPIPSPTAQPATGPDGGPPDSSAVYRIVIPRMNLDTVVKYVPFDGKTWLIGGLRQEVAWMGDTSWPGLGSNTGLAGHIDLADGSAGPFWNLQDLIAGDEVILYAGQKIYKYRVRQKVEVDETDLSVIQPSTQPQITLITCTGWNDNLRVYLRRLIVFADLETVSAQ